MPEPEPEEKWTELRQRVHGAVAELGQAGLGAIAARAGMAKNAVTQHRLRLVRDGYFERIPGASATGRRGTYRITDKQPRAVDPTARQAEHAQT